MKDYIGIDLGTKFTLVYSSVSHRTLFNEPTTVAYDVNSHKVLSVGYLADKIQGRAPFTYEIVSPVQKGSIADDDATYDFLNEIFLNLRKDRRMKMPVLIFTVPSDCTKVNRKMITSIASRLSAKEVYIESQAKMAALGSIDNAFSPTASLLCQIGGGISDIALISMGEVVSSKTSLISSSTIDEAIRRYILEEHHLSVGMKSAEYLKMRSGNLLLTEENKLTEIKGRDTLTSLPSNVILSDYELRSVLSPIIDILVTKIRDVISTSSPELAGDVKSNGLVLSGGGSLLGGLCEYMKKKLQIPVRLAEKPMQSVVLGFKRYISYLQEREK